jgi:hypothetical protein
VRDRPYFVWDVDVTDEELRRRLKSSDPDVRAQWEGHILAEARFDDVWQYLTVEDVLRDWPHIRRHLGRKRGFWEFLIDGWRRLGLIGA